MVGNRHGHHARHQNTGHVFHAAEQDQHHWRGHGANDVHDAHGKAADQRIFQRCGAHAEKIVAVFEGGKARAHRCCRAQQPLVLRFEHKVIKKQRCHFHQLFRNGREIHRRVVHRAARGGNEKAAHIGAEQAHCKAGQKERAEASRPLPDKEQRHAKRRGNTQKKVFSQHTAPPSQASRSWRRRKP